MTPVQLSFSLPIVCVTLPVLESNIGHRSSRSVAEGPIENGWAGYFKDSQTQYASFGGEQAIGESLHVTQFPGASLYLQFEGT